MSGSYVGCGFLTLVVIIGGLILLGAHQRRVEQRLRERHARRRHGR